MIIVAVVASLCAACAGWDSREPWPDRFEHQVAICHGSGDDCCEAHENPIEDNCKRVIFKLDGQDMAWLIQRARSEEYTGRKIENLLQHDWGENQLAVWWVDRPCPYQSNRNAITFNNGRCVAGYMLGCAEMYVATNQHDPLQICGTALVHEYGHCQRSLAGLGVDGAHADAEFWGEHLSAVSAEICLRMHQDDPDRLAVLLEDQAAVDREMAEGSCEDP